MRIVSLQSGTSADGVDVAVVDLGSERDADGAEGVWMRPLLYTTRDLPKRVRDSTLAATAGAPLSAFDFCQLDTDVGQAFAATADDVAAHVDLATIDLVVSHGQTVYHWVESGQTRGTLQLGEPSWIAERFGAPVLAQLRAADVAAGGTGAPLMSLFDGLWLAETEAPRATRSHPEATLNLGGIANLHYVWPDGTVVGWDVGPGNGLIDAVVVRATAGTERFDRGGRLAACGTVRQDLLDALLAHPYFALGAPKTTGRETFTLGVVDAALVACGVTHISDEDDNRFGPETIALVDLVATLTRLTAESICDSIAHSPAYPRRLIVSGGGVHNHELMRMLTDLLSTHDVPVVSSQVLGIDPDSKESLLFALIGYLSWHGIAAPLPAIPGRRPRILGQFVPGPRPLELPPPLPAVSRLTLLPPRTSL